MAMNNKVKVNPPKLRPVKEGKADKYGWKPNTREIKFFDTELPEVKSWNVGDEYEITLKVKQMSTGISEEKETEGQVYAKFQVTGVSAKGK